MYASEIASLLPKVRVLGTSTKDCYEMALRKSSLYVGEMAAFYERSELEQEGFSPEVVSPGEFDKLLQNLFPKE